MKVFFKKISEELGIRESQVAATAALLEEGGTVPFIARYRKERTGELDEVQIGTIRDRLEQLQELEKRREAIKKSIREQEKLTPELEAKIDKANTLSELEDIYLPYKPKRKTKASVAREKGLEPLASVIYDQGAIIPEEEAKSFIDTEKGVTNIEEALQGARDIIAEWINENAEIRSEMRELFNREAVVKCKVIKGKEEEGQKYKDYFDWDEQLKKVPSHRMLAMRRGEKEMFLTLDICPEESQALDILESAVIQRENDAAEHVRQAIKDCYRRLMKPSMETEARLESKRKADEEAINVFKENLQHLLLSAPLGQKNTLAIDPGFRTGCKVVCLDAQGKLLEHTAIYPNEPQRKMAESAAVIQHMVEKHKISAIAIGNGTASRETEKFVKSIGLPKDVLVVMVNESGASIYSASETAREEFPDYDVTVRGAVSIGRRLMDPLAELVKIDPKSIGVGQYQHDVDQNMLKKSLDDTVISCVNAVGVELNTASKEVLSYVSGLGPSLARNIVDYRNENGPFSDRKALKKVPRLGDKAFEQAAGFLRIRSAKNPLDASAVHPESYHVVEQMAQDLNASIDQLIKDSGVRRNIELKKYVNETVGLPTLQDILNELEKPGRDPRDTFEAVEFLEGVNTLEDLKTGMQMQGVVTNITNFGAFVDIGVHQDGLVHLSHIADQYVDNPADFLKVQQKVNVTVIDVDIPRKRISLSMKSDPFGQNPKKRQPSGKKNQTKQKSGQKDMSFEEKLAMLKGKFR